MDVIKKPDRQAKWRGLVLEHAESGLSQTEFCKQRNLNFPQFHYYLRKVKSECQVGSDALSSSNQLFSTVTIKKSELNTSEIKIILPNGLQCVIPSTMGVVQVKRLMEVLLSC